MDLIRFLQNLKDTILASIHPCTMQLKLPVSLNCTFMIHLVQYFLNISSILAPNLSPNIPSAKKDELTHTHLTLTFLDLISVSLFSGAIAL